MEHSSPRRILREDALAGKVALVTGSARGIGHAIALELAHAGSEVALNDMLDNEDSKAALQAVAETGRRVSFHQADVSDRLAVEAMIQSVVEQHGKLDILVNNAGVQVWEPFLEVTDAILQRIMDVDLKGVFLCGQVAARQMVRQKHGGRIINISSVHAVYSIKTAAVYDAAKAGVARLSATMALELAEHNITVNAIGPGWMNTPLVAPLLSTSEQRAEINATIPIGRIGQPYEVGQLTAYLCSEAGAYITGALILIDGGYILGR